jgi:DNA-binding transcriptional LysR family regulator
MEISFRQLRHVVAVAHWGSFSRAADELHISQPALSRSVAAVEQRFGVQLFDRSRSPIAPTAIGTMVIEHAERLMLQTRALEHNLSLWGDGSGGSVAFGMGPTAASVLLPQLLVHLAAHSPSLRVNARTNAAETLRAEMKRDEIEFIICDHHLIPAQDRLEQRPLGTIILSLFVRADHPLADRGVIGPEDMAQFPLARGSIPAGFELASNDMMLTQDASIICDNYHILKDVMFASDAIWLTSTRLVEEEVAAGLVRELPYLEGQALVSQVDMLWPRDRALSPPAQRIAEYLATALRIERPVAVEMV